MLAFYRELKADGAGEEDVRKAMDAWKSEHPMPTGDVYTVIDHIDHIVKVAGIDHVGLGGDYDGISLVPEQLDDVSCYPYVTQALLNRGYGEREIHKILGGNLLRAFRQAAREGIADLGLRIAD